MKQKLLRMAGLLLVLVLSLSLITGCSTAEEDTSAEEQPTTEETTTTDTTEEETVVDESPVEETPTEETAAEEVSTVIEITDQAGRVVVLEDVPERIISLAPSNTEILYSLNLGDRIVGVTEFCNYPEEALDKPKIGGYADVDIEKVLEADADVIFGTDMHVLEILPALEEVGQTVIILNPRSFDDILESFRIVGKATDKNNRAEKVVASMTERIETITSVTADLPDNEKPRTFYVMWHDPLMTVGGDTRISEMIEMAGGTSMFKDQEGYPSIDLETLVDGNPQVIIAGTGMGEGEDATYNFSLDEERLATSDARVNGAIYQINTDLTGRPTERMIEALEQMARMIHPELFE